MFNVFDGCVCFCNVLLNQVFSQYDVILIDLQGLCLVMFELIILVVIGEMIGMVKFVLLDVCEFMCGIVVLMEELILYMVFGISFLCIYMLVNCMDYMLFVKIIVEQVENIIVSGDYSQYVDKIVIDMFQICIYDLDVYKQGYVVGQLVYCFEKKISCKSDFVFDFMYGFVCELFFEWVSFFDMLVKGGECV